LPSKGLNATLRSAALTKAAEALVVGEAVQ
jgi:hypothetical protein